MKAWFQLWLKSRCPKVNWTALCCWSSAVLMTILLVALYLPFPQPQLSLATEVYDINHNLVTTFYKQNRQHLPLAETPDFLVKAFLAVEDHRFFEHHGINPGRILKAAWYDLIHGKLAQGASTITQQLAKNTYLNHERSFSRKFKELLYTIKLELNLNKTEILELYLNQIYFGHGAYGIKVAAETYFGLPLDQLNQGELALLAGLPKGPALYSPYSHPKAAQQRLNHTLKRMLTCGYIDAREYQIYLTQPLRLPGIKTNLKPAPYYLDLLQAELNQIFHGKLDSINKSGLIIESTLDLQLHRLAEQALSAGLPRLITDETGLLQPQGALIAIAPASAEIRVLIGGSDYQTSQFNRATQAKRQPGSAFKPILYAAALSKGYTLASLFDRTPKTYQIGTTAYQPTDGSNPHTSGFISLREALASSSNVVAVKLLEKLGVETVLEYASKMGISSTLPPLLSLALGSGEVTPLELSTTYLPLTNGGFSIKPYTIRRITDRKGKVLYEAHPRRRRVLSSGVAFLLTHALTDVFSPLGTAANLNGRFKLAVAGKTGTTEANRDAWFVGYNPQLLTTVFVGCDHNEKPLPGAANTVAAPIWANFMQKALGDNPALEFAIPEDVIALKICTESGLKATHSCPGRTEYFLQGTEPLNYCQLHRQVNLQICAVSNLLPGPNCNHLKVQEFPFGQQPNAICDQCRNELPLFHWFREWFSDDASE